MGITDQICKITVFSDNWWVLKFITRFLRKFNDNRFILFGEILA